MTTVVVMIVWIDVVTVTAMMTTKIIILWKKKALLQWGKNIQSNTTWIIPIRTVVIFAIIGPRNKVQCVCIMPSNIGQPLKKRLNARTMDHHPMAISMNVRIANPLFRLNPNYNSILKITIQRVVNMCVRMKLVHANSNKKVLSFAMLYGIICQRIPCIISTVTVFSKNSTYAYRVKNALHEMLLFIT